MFGKESRIEQLTYYRADLFYTRLDRYLRMVSYYSTLCREGGYTKWYREYYANLQEVFFICIGYIKNDTIKEARKEFREIKKIIEKTPKTRKDCQTIFERLENLYPKIKLSIRHLEIPSRQILSSAELLKEKLE